MLGLSGWSLSDPAFAEFVDRLHAHLVLYTTFVMDPGVAFGYTILDSAFVPRVGLKRRHTTFHKNLGGP